MVEYGTFAHVHVDGKKCSHQRSYQAEIDSNDKNSASCIAECERENSPEQRIWVSFAWLNSQKIRKQESQQEHIKTSYSCTTSKILGLFAPRPHSVPDN